MQYKNRIFFLFQDERMNLDEINEFRTTWNNEFFSKHKSKIFIAKYLIKKSIIIGKNSDYLN